MIALSIRQPWAWLIVNGFKKVENRTWLTKYRGEFLIHAGKKLVPADYDAAMLFIEAFVNPDLVCLVPGPAELPLGGVVGVATLLDCVTEVRSPWFTGGAANGGGFGFVLERAMPMPFMPWKGKQGFFNVDVKVGAL